MSKDPRILLLDIETAPNLGFVWGIWEQNVIDVKKSWYILSFAMKWLDDKKVQTFCLPDYKRFKSHKEDDKHVVLELWKALNEADIVIAHNGDRFDLRKANARFIAHGLPPPSPYQSIDTLKIARKHFKFDSNKLDDLGHYLGVGRKLPHTGKHLWLGCMSGNAKAWRTMRNYNAQDVALLEKVYIKLRPWATNHPNLNFFSRKCACPICQSNKTTKDGFKRLKTGVRQRFTCNSCGHKFNDGKLLRE